MLYLEQLWALYTSSLESNPLLTKCLTSFVGFVLGDTIAQLPFRGKYDAARTLRFALFGFFVHAPAGQAWYQLLDASVFPDRPTSVEAVLGKTLLDQCLYTPFSLFLFYVVLGIMEGRRALIGETLREKYRSTLLAGYAIWPLAHIVNFALIPSDMRILYVNVIQVFWNVILCRIAAPKGPAPGTPDAKVAAKRRERERGSTARVTVDLEEGPTWLAGASAGSSGGVNGKDQRPSSGTKWGALRQQSTALRQQDGQTRSL